MARAGVFESRGRQVVSVLEQGGEHFAQYLDLAGGPVAGVDLH